MDRRVFIGTLAGGLLAAPLAAGAQQAGKVWRIGYLIPVVEAGSPAFAAFRQRLHELGYVEGQNVALEVRSADGRPERYAVLAAELVRLRVDVIVAVGNAAIEAARKATRRSPLSWHSPVTLLPLALWRALRGRAATSRG